MRVDDDEFLVLVYDDYGYPWLLTATDGGSVGAFLTNHDFSEHDVLYFDNARAESLRVATGRQLYIGDVSLIGSAAANVWLEAYFGRSLSLAAAPDFSYTDFSELVARTRASIAFVQRHFKGSIYTLYTGDVSGSDYDDYYVPVFVGPDGLYLLEGPQGQGVAVDPRNMASGVAEWEFLNGDDITTQWYSPDVVSIWASLGEVSSLDIGLKNYIEEAFGLSIKGIKFFDNEARVQRCAWPLPLPLD